MGIETFVREDYCPLCCSQGSMAGLRRFQRFPYSLVAAFGGYIRNWRPPALQALQRSGQCGPLSVAGSRCLLPAAPALRAAWCSLPAHCSLFAAHYCCPLRPWPERCCVVRRLRATRARALSLLAARSSLLCSPFALLFFIFFPSFPSQAISPRICGTL